MRLTASGGRVLLGDTPLEKLGDAAALPDEVVRALRQWAWVAGRVVADPPDSDAGSDADSAAGSDADSAAGSDAVAVTRRGHQLAALVAAVRGEPVQYVDPISGRSESVGPGPGQGAEPESGWDGLVEPTPWATGLAVSGFVAVLMAALDLILTAQLRAAYGWIWIPANLLVGVGLAPTVLLLREIRFWRWIAYGIALGLVVAWLGLAVAAIF